jgi:SAM-dependent methyltransferase
MASSTTSPEFFDAKYERSADPWNFASSAYELQRYSAIVGSLRPRTFERAFEPGCSIGVLTERLAEFCKHVDALDVSARAIARASERCRPLPNVHIKVGSLVNAMPGGQFDLIVLSEIGYYFESPALAAIGKDLVSRLIPRGVLLGAHWLGYSPDHLLSGDQVHGIMDALPGLKTSFAERYPGYRINHWTKQG